MWRSCAFAGWFAVEPVSFDLIAAVAVAAACSSFVVESFSLYLVTAVAASKRKEAD